MRRKRDFSMIRQYDAQNMCDSKLKELGLYEKGWRTVFTKSEKYIGRCWHDSKRIELSLIHLNSRSEAELFDTIRHEIAHAIVGFDQGHNEIWRAKAIELGLSDPRICGAYVDADKGRSIQPSEVKPKRNFHRINKPCPICNKDAFEESSITLNGIRWTKLKCGHLVKQSSIEIKEFDFLNWESKSGKKLYPFQIEGIKFLEKAGGKGLIADEPGLGKTIQALGFIHANQEVFPVLWVCKTTLKLQMLKELWDWCNQFGQVIHTPKEFIIKGLPFYIISMDLLRNMSSEKLDSIGYKTVVADEIQHFKNPDSTRTAELRKLVSKAEYFIPLSGTPWKNRGQEYFPVLNMLDPVRFPSYEHFKGKWVDYYLDGRTGKYKQGGIKNIPAFREFTKDIIIRRMRDDVLPDLPPINRSIRFIDMESVYNKAYDKAEERLANLIKSAIIGGERLKMMAAEIMELKHITGLAKVKVTIEDVIEWLENTPDEAKITIFHHHIDVGDNLQKGDGHSFEGLDKWLVENRWGKTLRLYGGKSPEERDSIIQKCKNDINSRVLVASTLASGEGLNIQFCQNAIMMERQWNPANEEQAELRFSRPLTYGDYPKYLQDYLFDENKNPKKPSIRVPYMIADQTIDSMLTEIIERKRVEYNRSMNIRDEGLKWEENDIMQELADMIMKKRFGVKK